VPLALLALGLSTAGAAPHRAPLAPSHAGLAGPAAEQARPATVAPAPSRTVDQVALLLKVLTFDHALLRDSKRDLMISVIEDPLDPSSAATADTIFAELGLYDGQQLGGRTLKAMRRSVRDLLAKDDPALDVVVLAPRLENEMPRLLAWCRRNGCFSVSVVPELQAKGIAVWIGEDPKGPKIRINLTQARAEGRDLDARLLNLAMVER
jgi:hypothetical protein